MGKRVTFEVEFTTEAERAAYIAGYTWCRPGFVPIKLTDPSAWPVLWQYAALREPVDAEFSADLRACLLAEGYTPTESPLVAALRAALPVLEEAAEQSVYGHYAGGDPHLFKPAEDECTPEEIAAHKAACEAWERGERPDIPHACEPLREPFTYTNKKTGETITAEKGSGLALYAPFGVGIQTFIDEDAKKARDLVRAALEGT